MPDILTAAFYHFEDFPEYRVYRERLLVAGRERGVMGTVLLAREGVNGTIAGTAEAVRSVLDFIRSEPGFAAMEHKEAWTADQPFKRFKVKLKAELVPLGVDGIDAKNGVGEYVAPADWNRLISEPDVTVIDTRNDYEVAAGTFSGAIDPRTGEFNEFPNYVSENLEGDKDRRVAMFCTGGIRCEKATAYLRARGFSRVYHLKGGILKYLEDVSPEESLWEGECFVFDGRVTVDHDLRPGSYTLCGACGNPLSVADRAAPEYSEGISCPHCHGKRTPQQVASATQRQKQIELARERREKR